MGDDWEENIYWSHFRSVQFFQTLSGPYDEHLAIPRTFSKNLKEKLGEEISLKGPSGSTWNVGLLTIGDSLFFKDGWDTFVNDNSLKENDLLIFKYTGESRFEVLMFDHQSLCEKSSSYFVKKRSQNEQPGGCSSKPSPGMTTDACHHSSDDFSNGAERSEDINADSSYDDVELTPAKSTKKDNADNPTSIRQNSGTDDYYRERKRSLRSRSRSDPLYLESGRPVTEEGKESALQKANAASSPDSLMVIIKASQVSKNYFMLIPTGWANSHLPRESIDIILRVDGKTWKTRFFHNKLGGGRVRGGWKKFASENQLEEYDVCVFNISEVTSEAIFMDVSIFRARNK